MGGANLPPVVNVAFAKVLAGIHHGKYPLRARLRTELNIVPALKAAEILLRSSRFLYARARARVSALAMTSAVVIRH